MGSPAGRVHRAGWHPQHHAQLLHRDPPRRKKLVDILKPIWAEDDSPPTR